MYDQLETMQTAVDNVEAVPVFGYVDSALDSDTGITGHNEYSDANANNIPLVDGTGLSLQEIEKGFRDSISTLSRAFVTHFFGRSSFNTNKLKELMSGVITTCRADYTHNFRMFDVPATYMEDDVCFLVAYGIRYCFKSLVDNNITDEETNNISMSASGVLSYDDTKWQLLTEYRTVQHPVGKPFMWFGGDLPTNYICFSNGATYNWTDYPQLNNAAFRAILTRFTWKGARANNTTFTVPNFSNPELYPMSVSSLPNTLSTIGAKVPAHYHNFYTGTTISSGTSNINHYHSMNSSNDAGSHTHYLGDYSPRGGYVSVSKSWHEDSKFYGAYEWQGSGDEHGNDYEYYKTTLTPSIKAATHGNHSISVPQETHYHTHSGTVKPTGAGDFGTASGKYRPGTIKTILAVRVS